MCIISSQIEWEKYEVDPHPLLQYGARWLAKNE